MTDSPTAISVIVGPTAVGKTDLAVRVAERIGAEIISSDSRQIFRQMRIGTAVPDDQTLARVKHHLISELDIGEEYSAGIFADMARKRIAEIRDCGKRVVVTGGSTLYLRALVEGLDDIPEIAPAIRQSLTDRLHEEGSARLYRDLVNVDPEYANTLDESKSQRIIRGLEVYQGTGRPLSSYHGLSTPSPYLYDITVLRRPREVLYARIEKRVDRMMESGPLAEVESVLEHADRRGIDIPPTIGYRELIPVVGGERSTGEGVRLLKRNSRRYAKRQLTWFRDLDNAVWYDLDEWSADEVVDGIVHRAG